MSILWFLPLLKFAAGPALLLWWLRAWWMAPWAEYVSHEGVGGQKDRRYIITVRHTHWFPPFSKFERTYLRKSVAFVNDYAQRWEEWRYSCIKTGASPLELPWLTPNKKLERLLDAALVRDERIREAQEAIK